MLLALLITVAWAGQTRAESLRKGTVWTFDVTWKDAVGERRRATWSQPAEPVAADLAQKVRFPTVEANDAVAADLRAWARTLKAVDLTVKETRRGIEVRASGRDRDRVRTVLNEAEERQRLAMDHWMGEHGFLRTRKDEISFDHAAIAGEAAGELGALADALGRATLDARAYTEVALSFVQSIPYEKHLKNGGDAGYRRPLALLARNRGDCDSKTVLFLGLLEAAFPDLPKAIVTIPEHAFAAVGLPEAPGDHAFTRDGISWLFAEPVGPALAPLGQAAGRSKRAVRLGGGEVRPVR